MSNRAMTWAWESPIATPGAKFVLVALADHASDHAGEDWTCFPSVERLMQFTAQSRATVERHLAWLTGEGWISRVRRKAKNGRLGVYDYVLHRVQRDDETAPSDPESAPEITPRIDPDHASECSMDHASKCGPAMRQNEGQPCINLQHVLTPIEPSVEPSQSAGARGGSPDWGQEVWTIWPEQGRKASSLRLVREAVGAEISAGADPAALIAAGRAYVRDRTAWGASGAPVAPHRFFTEGRWENFKAVTPGGPGGLVDQARTVFACAQVREAVLAAKGEAWVISWLDPCGWDEGARRVAPGLTTRADKLREVSAIFRTLGVVVEGLSHGR